MRAVLALLAAAARVSCLDASTPKLVRTIAVRGGPARRIAPGTPHLPTSPYLARHARVAMRTRRRSEAATAP